jgi:multidrug resistance efflux pump
MEEYAITGAMPELQDIESINALQRKISEYANLIEENDNTSLKENLIARKLYYQEGIDRIQDELSMIEAKRLQRWKEGGLEDLLSRRVSVKSTHLENLTSSLEAKLALLKEEQQQLSIVSPFDGKVIDTYYRYPNEIKERGDPIVKLANPDSGFQVKAYILEKNIDLVRKGMKVRMESQVYQSLLEGYLYGTVAEIIDRRDVLEPQHTTQAFFEVLVDIDDYPHKPVHGSRVKIEILLGRGSVVSALLNRPFGERGESE